MALRARSPAIAHFLRSFVHAFDGIVEAARVQPNFAVHLWITAIVLVAAIAFRVALVPFVAILVLVALVLGLELMNTALEAYVDLATRELNPLARRAKDAAAGAVLVASIAAAFAGLAIFINAAREPRPPFAENPQSILALVGLAGALAVLAKARWGA